MKILVTGGAGYIGSVLTPLLLEKGYSVRVLDSLIYGGEHLIPHFQSPSFSVVKGDVRDRDAVAEAVKGCDVVIHLAAIVGSRACRKDPELAESVNVDGTRVVGEAAGRGRLVLFGSTGSNYGALVDQVCTEETPLAPLSLYGRTKTEAERYLLDHCDAVAYRFATAFGPSPRMRLDLLVNEFVYQAVRMKYLVVYESHFLRTFIHVYDIARSFLFALENARRMRGQVYNVGSEGMNYSKADLCEMIRKRVDYHLHFADVGEDADKRNYFVSYRKIQALGFATTVPLEQGIDELVRCVQVVDFETPFKNV